MERELISVIIPVYKTEQYLEKCVQSVLGQTYEDLEVILVDDGSPDACPAMCDAFAARDSRVRVIHKENGGQGSARNRGLDIARGRYIGFVDSDDYIAPDMYEKLYEGLTAADADMCLCDFVYVDGQGNEVRRLPPLEAGTIEPVQALERLEFAPGWWRYLSPANKLYKRELWLRTRFPEDRRYEDLFVAHKIYFQSRAAAVIGDVLYFYVQSEGSSTRSPATVRNLDEADGYMERYEDYRRRGLRKLASGSLGKAYFMLWRSMTTLDIWKERRAVWPRVRRMMAFQIRQMRPRAVTLGLWYVFETAKCAVKGRDVS